MNPKIGVLDSGVGGLSVLREIHRLLPDHPTLYFADQGHVPYGPRDPQEINTFVDAITRFLLGQGAKVIVVACHAASTASLYDLRAHYPDVPFVGMEPAVKPAAETTQSGVIGVLTTQATASGPLYQSVKARFAAEVQVLTQVAPELVQIVERCEQSTEAGRDVVRQYVQPMLDAGVEKIVLACTHFPFLEDEINALIGSNAEIVDPGAAVARQVARIWPQGIVPQPDINQYFTSGDPKQFQAILKTLLGISAEIAFIDPSSMSPVE